jgi:hypothetical protein
METVIPAAQTTVCAAFVGIELGFLVTIVASQPAWCVVVYDLYTITVVILKWLSHQSF